DSPWTSPKNCNDWPMPVRPLKGLPSGHASSSTVPSRASHATTTLPPISAVTPTRFRAGGGASKANASTACTTSLGPADRGLSPPKDRHKVIILATTKPAEAGTPVSHWSLEDLATRILNDAHYTTMSRSTIQRILSAAELKPHKVRSWMHSDDPQFENLA